MTFLLYAGPLALAAVVGYLLGSVNWSIILTWFFKNKEDIRKYGSGNAGMTNVLRTVGKVPAALTFVGDFLKCVAAVLLAVLIAFLFSAFSGTAYPPEFPSVMKYAAGMACVIGHIFPVFYGFRGGKGVVTAAAMIAFTDWRVFLLVLLTFAVMFAWKRIVSLASVTCAATYPVYAFLLPFSSASAGTARPCGTCCSPRRPPCSWGSRCSSSTAPTSAASSGGRRSPSS